MTIRWATSATGRDRSFVGARWTVCWETIPALQAHHRRATKSRHAQQIAANPLLGEDNSGWPGAQRTTTIDLGGAEGLNP
jgi:hypothetical protein